MNEPALGFDEQLLLTDPGFYLWPDRKALYRRLRSEAPVSFHPERVTPWRPQGGRGYWAVLRHKDVVEVTRNPKVYSSAQGTNPNDEPEVIVRALGMLHMDDPEHRWYRAIVQPAFSPAFLDNLLPMIVRNADRVIDALLAEADVDVVARLVNTYPINVIADMLALPEADKPQFVEWTRLAFSPDRVRGEKAHHELIAYGTELARDRRRQPGDDVVSRIVTAQVEGRPLSDGEMGGFISLLIGAGAETTGSTIGGGLQLLHDHPDQWQKWKADPTLTQQAVDEILRSTSAVVNFRRTTTEVATLGGQLIPVGSKVVMFYESANNDETVFERPEDFDIGRSARKHLAFGAGGPHQCLGEQLGKREIRTFFDRFNARVGSFAITKALRLAHSPRFNMVAELRGRFQASERS
jgi:cytochrome P450